MNRAYGFGTKRIADNVTNVSKSTALRYTNAIKENGIRNFLSINDLKVPNKTGLGDDMLAKILQYEYDNKKRSDLVAANIRKVFGEEEINDEIAAAFYENFQLADPPTTNGSSKTEAHENLKSKGPKGVATKALVVYLNKAYMFGAMKIANNVTNVVQSTAGNFIKAVKEKGIRNFLCMDDDWEVPNKTGLSDGMIGRILQHEYDNKTPSAQVAANIRKVFGKEEISDKVAAERYAEFHASGSSTSNAQQALKRPAEGGSTKKSSSKKPKI